MSGDEEMMMERVGGPEDAPTTNQKKGFAFGAQGEYYRYKHMFHKQPTEADRMEAMRIGEKLRCDVCLVLLRSLVSTADDFSMDAIADALEGNTDYEMTGEVVDDQMLKHKKGCQKHFKDDLIAHGWVLKTCNETGEVGPDKGPTDPCLHKSDDLPSDWSINAYELWKEGVFYACEKTIGRYNDDLASFLSEELPGSSDKDVTLKKACEEQAQCRRVHKPKASKKPKESKKKRKEL